MKRLLAICLILAACIIPAQASFVWDNGSGTIWNPVLFTDGCNSSNKIDVVTHDEAYVGAASKVGFSSGGGTNIDGHLTYTDFYFEDLSITGYGYPTLGQSRISTDWRQTYTGTCDINYLLVDARTATTPANAIYIPAGGNLSYVLLGNDARASDYNVSSDGGADIYRLPGDVTTRIVFAVRFDAGAEKLGWINDTGGVSHYFTTTPPGPPIADFNGTPTNGSAPLTVVFTDTSTNTTATSWNWTSTPNTGVFISPSSTSEDVTMLFTASGNYTITHCAANDMGSDCEVKTEYIWVYNATSMITTPWRAEDMVFGGLVANATIDLLDIENDSWVNVTSSTGTSSITTLADHKLSGYGFAVGFNDAEQLIVEPQAFPGYVLYMYPTGFTNVSEGNVTVFVKAEDVDTGLAVIGATVTGQAAGGGSQVKTTNSAGWAQFVFPNNTNVHFKAEKSGYTGSTTIVLNTGVPSGGDTFVSGTVYLTKGTITSHPTTTVTTLPGGGTPTPVQTYLPHCDPAASDYSAEECRAEQSSFSLSWLADNMLLLIQICFIFTILYIAGWKP